MVGSRAADRALLPFWQRLLITVASMLLVSFLAGWFWNALFGFIIPSYISGIIGGLTALPVWELLKRVRPKNSGGAG